MRLYPLAPDPEQVRKHFIKMAKGEIKTLSSQTGFGFAGSRVRMGGGSVMLPPDKSVTVNRMTPSEVGVRQARSQLIAGKLNNRKSGIKRPRSASSRQKVERKRTSKSSSSSKDRGKKKKNKKEKKKQQKKKIKRGDKKKNPKKSTKKKVNKRRDNFS
jgi:hypothetical protein